MLQYLREQSGSWIIKIILGLIIIIFAFFFGVGGFGPKGQGPVAMVNDQNISFEEYKKSYEFLVNQVRQRFGDNADQKILEQLNVKENALTRLIEEKLVLEQVEKFGVKALDKELSDILNSFAFFKTNGVFNFDQYKSVLANNSMTPEMFENGHKREITQKKMRELIFDTVMVSDSEALKWHKFLNTKVSINYIKLDPEKYTEINPSREEIESYYSENQEDYKTALQIKAQYLKFSNEDYKDKIKASEKEIKQYYKENSQVYNIPEKVEARHILIKTDESFNDDKIEEKRKQAVKIYEKALTGKKDFAALAKEYSEGPSKSNGGFLGQFTKEDMVKPFSDKAFSMTPGEISKPVKTRFGWHIIKVEKRIEATTKSYIDAKDEIEKIIAGKKIADLAYYDAGDAFDAVVDGESLEQAGLLTQRKIIETGPFAKNGIGLNFDNGGQFASAAFTTPINEISNIIEIENSYYLVKPILRIEPEVIKFDIIQNHVKNHLIAKLQKEKVKTVSDEILSLSKESKTLIEIAKEQNLEIKSSELFDRNGSIPEIGYAPDISKASFELENINETYSKVIDLDNIFYIIALKKRAYPKAFKDEKEEQEIKTKLLNQKKQAIYRAWIDNLKAVNEVKILTPKLIE